MGVGCSKEKRADRGRGKTPAGKEKRASNGGAYIEEVESEPPDSSRPGSRAAWVEEAPDVDSSSVRQRFCVLRGVSSELDHNGLVRVAFTLKSIA